MSKAQICSCFYVYSCAVHSILWYKQFDSSSDIWMISFFSFICIHYTSNWQFDLWNDMTSTIVLQFIQNITMTCMGMLFAHFSFVCCLLWNSHCMLFLHLHGCMGIGVVRTHQRRLIFITLYVLWFQKFKSLKVLFCFVLFFYAGNPF